MILVIDYGMGNLRSVSKALEHLGAEVKISGSYKDLDLADKAVLPGVGAFGDACDELRRGQWVEPIRKYVADGRPFLGICLGLQLFFGSSEESPGTEGLNLLPGRVVLFREKELKVPHMGWNQTGKVSHPLWQGIPDQSYFYFVHSYYAVCEDSEAAAAPCTYGSTVFPAALGKGNLFATQFHPEKSQKAGLQLLKNFVEWS